MEITTEMIIGAISIVSAVIAIIFAIYNFRRAEKDDGKMHGTLLSDVGYIKSSVDDVKRRQESAEQRANERHEIVLSRLAMVEASAASAHKRLDEHVQVQGGKQL